MKEKKRKMKVAIEERGKGTEDWLGKGGRWRKRDAMAVGLPVPAVLWRWSSRLLWSPDMSHVQRWGPTLPVLGWRHAFWTLLPALYRPLWHVAFVPSPPLVLSLFSLLSLQLQPAKAFLKEGVGVLVLLRPSPMLLFSLQAQRKKNRCSRCIRVVVCTNYIYIYT